MTERDPIVIHVDGQRVEGALVHLHPNDLEVGITAPFHGPHTGSHIPAQAMGHYRFAERGELTDIGRERASELLAELYRAGPPSAGPTVRFAHGKESGPWGTKIQSLAAVAERHGFAVESLDYRDLPDPDDRTRRLALRPRPEDAPLVLVGSSMGGYVSTVASEHLKPQGLFLLAPAFYLDGYLDQDPTPHAAEIEVIHGWSDDDVPVEHAVRFARRWRHHTPLRLHLLPDGHRLVASLAVIEALFDRFLARILESGRSITPPSADD